VDGEEISAIPDAEVLDDWADSPTVTSSEITDRDDFNTLSYQGPDPTDRFNPAGSRPDWTVVGDDTPIVDDTDEELRLVDDSRVFTTQTIEVVTVEMRIEDSFGRGFCGVFSANTDFTSTGGPDMAFDDSYGFDIGGNDLNFGMVENGEYTQLISGTDSPSYPLEIKAEIRDAGSNWEFEFWIDDNSQGTETEAKTFSETEYIGLTGRGSDGDTLDLSWLEVYPTPEEVW